VKAKLGQALLQFSAEWSIADEQEIDIRPISCDGRERGQECAVILHRVKARDGRDVSSRGIETEACANRARIRSATVPCDVDPVLDDLDRLPRETVAFPQAGGAEATDGIHVVGEPAQEQSIDEAPLRGDDIGIVAAMFREDDPWPDSRQLSCQRAIEKGRVLVGVNDLESAGLNRLRHIEDDAAIEPWLPSEREHLDALGTHLFAEHTDTVETQDYRLDPRAQPADRLGDEYFGSSDIHRVENEANADGLRHHCLRPRLLASTDAASPPMAWRAAASHV
jgi:hypothetical protein